MNAPCAIMFTPTRRTVLLILMVGCYASPVSALARQDGPPDNREAVKGLLDELADYVKKSGRDDPGDSSAIKRINQLCKEFKLSGPKDKKVIIRGLGRVFLAKRRAEKDGSQKTALFIIAARGLGGMGTDASDPLLKWIDSSRHKNDLALQRELILSLGRTKSKKARNELQDLLKDVRPTFKGAAATGLGMFAHEPSKVRKELFEDLLKALMQAKANSLGQNSTAQEIWSAINAPATSSMRKLSGGSGSSPEAWQRWWNKNKRRDWDK
ncbi:MAG TPA: HEAT repeat domain-containing protein [Planctomycetes bacterium]|nr:HEAT repeat domain-containing protein [Planctomycetota bacterium]